MHDIKLIRENPEAFDAGLARRGYAAHSEHHVFPGDRSAIRAATVATAFALIRSRL